MPPHCDAIDGPVARAALAALNAKDVEIALPFVAQGSEAEVRATFEAISRIRTLRGSVREVADRLFIETVVRLHRLAEGAPFTGMKPAGLDHGHVIPLAEAAIATGSPDALIDALRVELEVETKTRLNHVLSLQARAHAGLSQARAYITEMLSFQVWSNQVHRALGAQAHRVRPCGNGDSATVQGPTDGGPEAVPSPDGGWNAVLRRCV